MTPIEQIKELEKEIERLESIRCSLIGEFHCCEDDDFQRNAIDDEINDIDLVIEDIICSIQDIYADMEIDALIKKELRGK